MESILVGETDKLKNKRNEMGNMLDNDKCCREKKNKERGFREY